VLSVESPWAFQEGQFALNAPFSGGALKQKSKPFQEFPCSKPNSTRCFPSVKSLPHRGALAALEKAGQSPVEFLSQHVRGELGRRARRRPPRKPTNQLSLERGFLLLSSYRTNAAEKIWVITEADRSATTLLC
jgi:hypothetical protein